MFHNTKNVTKIAAMRDIQRPLSKLVPKKDSIIDTIRVMSRSPETDLDVMDKNM